MRYRLFFALTCWLIVAVLAPVAHAQTLPTPTPPPAWNGTSRYTVLVLGLDRRPNERSSLLVRTDVMLIASYDPTTRQLGVFHIPRDLHLPLPDVGEMVRVNTILQLGENRQEGYGAYYVMQTLQYNFGIPIHAYVMFDFTAFTRIVDAVGGVTVDVPYAINDPDYPDMNYGYEPFFIRAGTQRLDGRTALKYVRTRHDDSDYARGRRQIQVLTALRDRLKDPAVINNLLLKVPQLARDLERSIYTNVPLDQWVFIGLLMLEANVEVVGGGIDDTSSYIYTLTNGTRVRVPNLLLMPDVLKDVFGEYWR